MPKKYLDFPELVPHVRPAKQNARDEWDTRNYITITCPHCSVDFVEIAVDSATPTVGIHMYSVASCLAQIPPLAFETVGTYNCFGARNLHLGPAPWICTPWRARLD